MLNPRVKRAAGGSGMATSRSVQAQPPDLRVCLALVLLRRAATVQTRGAVG
jgi:hypothetical protein